MSATTGYLAEWAEEYAERLEYQHLSREQLIERYSALLNNTVEFHDSGTPFVRRDSAPYWSKRLCWTEIEFSRRSLGTAAEELEQAVLSGVWPNIAKARLLWSKSDPPELGQYLLKFSKARHVRDMLSFGRFRISPARTYKDDPSLCAAVMDDELLSEYCLPAGSTLSVKLKPDADYVPIAGLVGHPRIVTRCDNFYVFCASGKFQPRLFDDFEADACLLVRDIKRFGLALIRGVAPAIGATHVAHGSVKYLDSLHYDRHHPVEMTKDYKYEYQQEWRVSWKGPTPPADDAKPVLVDIGPLHDSCEALYL